MQKEITHGYTFIGWDLRSYIGRNKIKKPGSPWYTNTRYKSKWKLGVWKRYNKGHFRFCKTPLHSLSMIDQGERWFEVEVRGKIIKPENSCWLYYEAPEMRLIREFSFNPILMRFMIKCIKKEIKDNKLDDIKKVNYKRIKVIENYLNNPNEKNKLALYNIGRINGELTSLMVLTNQIIPLLYTGRNDRSGSLINTKEHGLLPISRNNRDYYTFEIMRKIARIEFMRNSLDSVDVSWQKKELNKLLLKEKPPKKGLFNTLQSVKQETPPYFLWELE